jgi:hypothetical protein
MFLRWLLAFAVTQAVEIPIYRRFSRATAFEAFGASAMTHPIVWFVIPWAWSRLYGAWFAASLPLNPIERHVIYFVVAELFAVIAEAAYMKALGRERPFVVALGANAASVTSGLLLRALFGLP